MLLIGKSLVGCCDVVVMTWFLWFVAGNLFYKIRSQSTKKEGPYREYKREHSDTPQDQGSGVPTIAGSVCPTPRFGLVTTVLLPFSRHQPKLDELGME